MFYVLEWLLLIHIFHLLLYGYIVLFGLLFTLNTTFLITFWYNVTPRKEMEESSVPSNLLFRYHWRVPFDVNLRTEGGDVESSFSVGDEVWVKPSPPSCVKQWMPG